MPLVRFELVTLAFVEKHNDHWCTSQRVLSCTSRVKKQLTAAARRHCCVECSDRNRRTSFYLRDVFHAKNITIAYRTFNNPAARLSQRGDHERTRASVVYIRKGGHGIREV